MPKYYITYITAENCKDDNEAVQLALNSAKNERKRFDNNCKVESIIEYKGFNRYRNVEIK